MAPTDHKDLFAQAYVRAVAAVAGYIPGGPELDRESCDIQLSSAGGFPGMPPRLEVQIKGTKEQPEAGELVYDLKQKNYDDLRYQPVMVPRLLVVVTIPGDDRQAWMTQSEEQLVMRRCGFWLSLRGRQASGNDTKTRIQIPTNQRFDVAALQVLMNGISNGIFP